MWRQCANYRYSIEYNDSILATNLFIYLKGESRKNDLYF